MSDQRAATDGTLPEGPVAGAPPRPDKSRCTKTPNRASRIKERQKDFSRFFAIDVARKQKRPYICTRNRAIDCTFFGIAAFSGAAENLANVKCGLFVQAEPKGTSFLWLDESKRHVEFIRTGRLISDRKEQSQIVLLVRRRRKPRKCKMRSFRASRTQRNIVPLAG